MANELFKNFPEVRYTLSNGKIVTIKDFFRKAKLEGTQLNQVIDYTVYELQEGERPDTVASGATIVSLVKLSTASLKLTVIYAVSPFLSKLLP